MTNISIGVFLPPKEAEKVILDIVNKVFTKEEQLPSEIRFEKHGSRFVAYTPIATLSSAHPRLNIKGHRFHFAISDAYTLYQNDFETAQMIRHTLVYQKSLAKSLGDMSELLHPAILRSETETVGGIHLSHNSIDYIVNSLILAKHVRKAEKEFQKTPCF